MTTGTINTGYSLHQQKFYNGTPSGFGYVGDESQRIWSGSDAAPTRKVRGKKRTYTYLDKKGKVRRKTFYERPLRRENEKKTGEHAYSVTYKRWSYRQGILTNHAYSTATGAIINNRTYTNLSYDYGYRSGFNIPLPPTFGANDQLKLVSKLRDRVRGGSFNPALFIGEGHQTLRMIGDTAVRLARAYSAVRRGDVSGAFKHLAIDRKVRKVPPTSRASIGSRWLELKYGWMPLLQDMKDGAELLNHQIHTPTRTTFRARHKVARTDLANHGYSTMKYAGATAYISRDIKAILSEQGSWPEMTGIANPELVAWELLPFSFVVDWFMPFGTYLEARAAARSLRGLYVTSTKTFVMVTGHVGIPQYAGSYYTKEEWLGPPNWYQSTSISRTISTSLDVPMPEVKPLSESLSVQHCLNGLALLAQVVLPGARGTRSPSQPNVPSGPTRASRWLVNY